MSRAGRIRQTDAEQLPARPAVEIGESGLIAKGDAPQKLDELAGPVLPPAVRLRHDAHVPSLSRESADKAICGRPASRTRPDGNNGAGVNPRARPTAAPPHALARAQPGMRTLLMTWMTPFDCMTFGIVTSALSPLLSITHR